MTSHLQLTPRDCHHFGCVFRTGGRCQPLLVVYITTLPNDTPVCINGEDAQLSGRTGSPVDSAIPVTCTLLGALIRTW
jgi:hypothetical protein